jgi:hypothetical protein
VIDSKISTRLNDEQQDKKEPGFAIVSSAGTALYELATPK